MNRLCSYQGSAASYPIQTYVGGGSVPALYGSDDTLTAAVVPARSTTPVFAPAVAWYARPDPITGLPTQTGYEQGQVIVTFTNAQQALLMPTIAYTLVISLQPAATPGATYTIARLHLDVLPVAFPA